MISDWIDEWRRNGFECRRDYPNERVPFRSSIAHFITYRLGGWRLAATLNRELFWQRQLDYNRNTIKYRERRGINLAAASSAENLIPDMGFLIEQLANARLNELERSLGLR
jgi:hypothetical protein